MWIDIFNKFRTKIWNKIYQYILSIDRISFGVLLILMSLSAFDLMNSLYIIDLRLGFSQILLLKKHLIFMVIFFLGIIIISNIPVKYNLIIVSLIGLTSILLCFLTIFIGVKINGARRWINLGFITLQPSVFIKNTIGIFLPFICKNLKEKLILLSFICLLVLFQPDFGMCLLIFSIAITEIILITDLNIFKKYYYIIFIIIGILSIFFLFKGNYFILRFNKFFSKEGLYQSNVALYNIRNTNFFHGYKGILIPDGHTDFIFASIITNYGLVAGLFIIILYLIFFISNINYSEKQDSILYKIIIYGILIQIVYQSIFHISSNLNLIPPKGVSLPFISYGGSELLANIFSIGTLLSLTKQKILLSS